MEKVRNSIAVYRQELEHRAAQLARPQEGFFGPDSMAWRVNRDAAMGLGALRALLMQVAHPAVARGVAEHSRFMEAPFKRAYNTFRIQQQVVFGAVEDAAESLLRLRARHTTVTGDGYAALDPLLQLWVWGTLIDSTLYVMETFMRRRSDDETRAFYLESQLFGSLLGIPAALIPGDIHSFRGWMAAELEGGVIRVTPEAFRISESLMRLPLRAFRPLNRWWAGVTLPAELAKQYGLPAVEHAESQRDLVRRAVALTPWWARSVPAYWKALRRAKAHIASP